MNTRSVNRLGTVLLLIAVWTSQFVAPARAASTWVVDSLGDGPAANICRVGNCSLRSAINSAASGDSISFAASVAGTIYLNFGGLTIAKNLSIHGPGASILTVGGVVNNAPVFKIESGITLNLSSISITHGRNYSGAGIYNYYGNLTLVRCNLLDSTALTDDGGALYNQGGTVTISQSYFGANGAQEGFGGALANNETGVISISNSTFSDNHAVEGGAIDNSGTLAITNSTLKNNGGSTTGGIINETGGSATLINVLLADNSDMNCSGAMAGGSTHNLSTDGSCLPGFGQLSAADLAFGPLTGNPAYFALNNGSAAIDAGTNSGCPPIDQTGKPRPLDGDMDGSAVCDAGAFEAWPVNSAFQFLPLVLRH